ncbi:metallophosphoesterase [Bradyrhizobium diazoefficiens]
MTLLAVQSDLHIDQERNGYQKLPPVEADVLVVIGDTTNAMTRGLHWIADNLCGGVKRCIYVPGNHDFYRAPGEENTFYEDQMARGREIAASLGIDLLQNDVLHLDEFGVRIAGATLWSDFSLLPPGWTWKQAMYYSQNGRLGDDRWSRRDRHNDYVEIRMGAGNNRHRLSPSDTLRMHKESFAFFERVLSTPYEGETVCVSHMGPASSVDTKDMHSWLYGSSDIVDGLMKGPNAPAAWLHGHVHKSFDYCIGPTRVVCNPRGYAFANGMRENPDFDPTLVVEIEPRQSLTMNI